MFNNKLIKKIFKDSNNSVNLKKIFLWKKKLNMLYNFIYVLYILVAIFYRFITKIILNNNYY
jgi:hypothetical protein